MRTKAMIATAGHSGGPSHWGRTIFSRAHKNQRAHAHKNNAGIYKRRHRHRHSPPDATARSSSARVSPPPQTVPYSAKQTCEPKPAAKRSAYLAS